MELTKDPVPVPSVVWSFATVGFGDALQTTPRAVTDAPPSAVTWPPAVAVVEVIPVTELVVTVGGVGTAGVMVSGGCVDESEHPATHSAARAPPNSVFNQERFISPSG
jgi:hypothetical protein